MPGEVLSVFPLVELYSDGAAFFLVGDVGEDVFGFDDASEMCQGFGEAICRVAASKPSDDDMGRSGLPFERKRHMEHVRILLFDKGHVDGSVE